MKITSSLLVLCAAPAAAFMGPGSKEAMKPAFSYMGDASQNAEQQAAKPAAPIPTADTKASALEARLAQLESSAVQAGGTNRAQKIWDKSSPVTVQGGSLKTWSFVDAGVDRVQVVLGTEGRPLEADIELWQGPDNTPHKMRVYVEDGSVRPFSAVIETPRGPNTIAIRNVGHLEFPLSAYVVDDAQNNRAGPVGSSEAPADMTEMKKAPQTIQGGALRTYPFDPTVESVQLLLKTDGRPLNARIELLQGPNNNKQVIELYTEDGLDRPFYMILETPGSGNVVRIVNSATVEFPLTAWVEPYLIGSPGGNGAGVVLGGDGDSGGFMTGRQW